MFTIIQRQRLKGYRVQLQDREREPVLRRMRVTPLDFCLRIIVNEKPLNLEKTTSSVLSVLLLIYGIIIRIAL